MRADRLDLVRRVPGFMPAAEGIALHEAGLEAAAVGPLLEIGSWCGTSAVYLGDAAEQAGTVLFCVDHHRGSEENQEGWEHHDASLVDRRTGRIDTLPRFRLTIEEAGLEATVVAVVGESTVVARHWQTRLGMVFVDGGHGREPAHADYESWAPLVGAGGLLAIHDVFEKREEGGRPPYEVWRRAIESGNFESLDRAGCGSLRVLRRIGDGC